MDALGDTVDWFTQAAQWRGTGGIPHRLWEHAAMSVSATLAAMVLAVPLGFALGHGGRRGALGAVAVNVANVGRALPSYGILVLFALVFGLSGWPGFGARPAFVALVALAVPPMVTNTYVGVRDVDADARDAARGMGMTGWQLLRRVEAPLAVPLVLAGVRTSAVQVVATATLAAVTGWGGLGRFIVDGFAQQDDPQIIGGALLAAGMALLTEVGLGAVQRWVRPGAPVTAVQAAPSIPPAA